MLCLDAVLEQGRRSAAKGLRVAAGPKLALAAALCGVVSMAATESEIGRFDTVIASDIFVENDKGQLVIVLSTTDSGNNGLVSTTCHGLYGLETLTFTSWGFIIIFGELPTVFYLV